MYRVLNKDLLAKMGGLRKTKTTSLLWLVWTQKDNQDNEYIVNVIQESPHYSDMIKMVRHAKHLNEEFIKKQEDLDKKKRKK